MMERFHVRDASGLFFLSFDGIETGPFYGKEVPDILKAWISGGGAAANAMIDMLLDLRPLRKTFTDGIIHEVGPHNV